MTRRGAVVVMAVVAVAVALIAGGAGVSPAGAERAGGDSLRVGLVTDIGQLNDRGFNQLAYEGLKRAEKRLGVDGRVLQSGSAADYIPNMASLARQGYDLVIGVGFAQGNAVDAVATRYPKTRFAIIDVSQRDLKHRPRNVVGLLFREQEVGYLAGYLAALVERRRPGADVISSVGGMKEPPVDRFIAGWRAGARRANPKVRLLNGYSQDWDDQAKCKEVALDHIARGAGVVFQVAGGCGLGALDAAKERRIWGVGVDADQSFLGSHILTSAQKKVDQAVFLTIAGVKSRTWRGGRDLTYGLRQGGVGLAKINPRVAAADRRRIEDIARRIARGQIRNIPTEVP